MRLEGQVAIVTGGGAGIGRAVANGFAAEGARVVIADWDADTGARVVQEITDIGGTAIYIKTDVSSTNGVAAMVQSAVEQLGQLDILFNNAAVQLHGQDARVHEVSEEIWDRTIDINLKGYWRCMKSSIPHMLEKGGTIINVASPTGMLGVAPGYSAYSSSKGGVFALTKVAAAEYGADRIRVNAIVPGATLTPLTEDIFGDDEERGRFEARSPLQRIGRPEDLVGISLFLASDDSAYCTGGVYMADGGQTAV